MRLPHSISPRKSLFPPSPPIVVETLDVIVLCLSRAERVAALLLLGLVIFAPPDDVLPLVPAGSALPRIAIEVLVLL